MSELVTNERRRNICVFALHFVPGRQRIPTEETHGAEPMLVECWAGVADSGPTSPQGSILGPFLYILFINDMPLSCFSSKTGIFADDAKIYMEIKNNLDCTLLQADLDRLYEWSVAWRMNFSHSKCKILTVSRRKAPVFFQLYVKR